MGTLHLDNNRTRCIIENFEFLIDLTVVDNYRKMLWKISVDNLRKAINVIKKKKITLSKKLMTFRSILVSILKTEQHCGEK